MLFNVFFPVLLGVYQKKRMPIEPTKRYKQEIKIKCEAFQKIECMFRMRGA